jgi:Tol biopolymer transport system component
VVDFSYSPDGEWICFSEQRGKTHQVFRTSASQGYICRQITSSNNDYSPIYTADMTQIFFARQESNSISIWGYDVGNNFLSSYTVGMNPCPLPNEPTILCTRMSTANSSEIWKINYATGVEECLISEPNRSFASPCVSPDGEWILFVGESVAGEGSVNYRNTDLYVARVDGTMITQLTYHAADDLSPAWSKDGQYIYFVSQRGSAEATANIWRMTFPFAHNNY